MSEYIPYNLCLMILLKEKGHEIKYYVVLNKKNSIIMEKSRKNSCTGNSIQIHVRYFSWNTG